MIDAASVQRMHTSQLLKESAGVLECNDGMKTLIGLCLSEDAMSSLRIWASQLLWQHGGPSHGAS